MGTKLQIHGTSVDPYRVCRAIQVTAGYLNGQQPEAQHAIYICEKCVTYRMIART